MDYKKELEDALERARKLDSPFYRQAAEIIFPQLKENADEKNLRIIKNALEFYYDGKLSDGNNDTDYAECLAWVNKQLYKNPTEEFVRDSKLIEEEYKTYVLGFYFGRIEGFTFGAILTTIIGALIMLLK